MLVLSRRPQERIVFPTLGVEVEILGVSGNTVRVGVNAPREVLVLRHEVAEKDAARAAQSSPPPVEKSPIVKAELPPPPIAPAADAIAASRKWIHELRNYLNTAGLALQVAQAQLARGEPNDADSKLQMALAQLTALDAALSSGPMATSAAAVAPTTVDPISAAAGQPANSRETSRASASQRKPAARGTEVAKVVPQPTALVVEDDANESALLAAVLRLNGFRVDTASDGCHALDYLASHKRPDVVLLDMRMPRCDGPTTISRIRNNPELSGLRVVAVSGSRSSEVGVSTGPQGVDRWFCKPLDPRRLVHELKHDLQVTTRATL